MTFLLRLLMLVFATMYFSSCQMLPEKQQQPDKTVLVKNQQLIAKREEARARATARKIESILERNGSVYSNPKITAYLQTVMNKLYPKYKGRMNVKILKFTHLNAFALANGTIYFNLGLIARLENEAQLATVLGHEGAHYVYKHLLKRRLKIKAATLAGSSKSTLYGYSRALERSADQQAFVRLKKAGYDTSEAYKVFEHLLDEVTLLRGHKPGLVRLHPKLVDRITSFKKLHAKYGNKSGVLRNGQYNQIMRKVKIADLEANLAAGNYKSVILILERPRMNKDYPKFFRYYLGEAYRLRGHAGDYNKAAESYLQSTRNAPQFSPAYNALGIYYLKQVKLRKARQYFRQYLKLNPQGKHAAYANHYIMSIDNKIRKGSN